jgi:hypothetical protein
MLQGVSPILRLKKLLGVNRRTSQKPYYAQFNYPPPLFTPPPFFFLPLTRSLNNEL